MRRGARRPGIRGRLAPGATGLVALWLAVAASSGSCSADPGPVAASGCRVPSFRGCDAPCGRGVSTCQASGHWGPCECTLVDGALPDAAGDAPDDAPDGSEADVAPEAATDASGEDARPAKEPADSAPRER